MNISQWIIYGKQHGYFDQARAAAIKEAQLEEMQALNTWLNLNPMARMRRPELQKYISTRIRALKPLEMASTRAPVETIPSVPASESQEVAVPLTKSEEQESAE